MDYNDLLHYKKRLGTYIGIMGQLYETKLISFIHFKATHDENVEDFWLAANMDGLGVFDDICFKVRFKGIERPIAVFIQTKHRESEGFLTLSNTNELADYFENYLKFTRSFKPNDILFNEKISDLDFLFVHYTNVRDDIIKNADPGDVVKAVTDLIGTGDDGAQISYNDEDVNVLSRIALKDEIISLAENMVKFLNNVAHTQLDFQKNYERIWTDNILLRYRVILAQKVWHISEIRPEGYCIASFRKEFLDTNEEFLMLLRDTLFTILLLKKSNKEEKSLLNTFKVPVLFGINDLIIRGSDEKVERRLQYITSKFVSLFQNSNPDNIVTIDGTMESGFLQLNGGVGGAMGTLLVPDENPKLIKFTDNFETLGELSKRLYIKLVNAVQNLSQYKLNVQVKNMPTLSITVSEKEENLARDFLNKLLFYTNQADVQEIEGILVENIKNHHLCIADSNFRVRAHIIFLIYHDYIQKWWMHPKANMYLTKENDIFRRAIDELRY